MPNPTAYSIAPQDALDLTKQAGKKPVYSRGGMGANIAVALEKREEQRPHYVALHGKQNETNAREHLRLLSKEGVGLFKRTLHRLPSDLGLNTCTIDSEGKETWTQTGKGPLGAEIADAFLDIIKTSLTKSSGSIAVLNSCEEDRLGKDFLSSAAKIAVENNHVVIYNPCIHDKNQRAEAKLFRSGALTLVKPNLDEFMRFLVTAGLVSSTKATEVQTRLKKQVQKREFNEILELSRKLMASKGYKIPLIIVSLGKDGALFVSRNRAHYSSAPEIKVTATSAAGDTAVVGLIAAANKSNININSSLDSADLYKLTNEFVYSGAATAIKPGSEIADEAEIQALKDSSQFLYERTL